MVRDEDGKKLRFAETLHALVFAEQNGLRITEHISERGQVRLNVVKGKKPYTLVVVPVKD